MIKPMYIYIGLIILALIIYLSRNKIKSLMTRGYINKNPGNLNRQQDVSGNYLNVGDAGYKPFNGEVKSTDQRFRAFSSMPYGYRAMFVNLSSYINRGINTVEKIISSWAPQADNNNTKAYIAAVSSAIGKNPTDAISKTDTTTLRKLVAAISKQENGIPANMDDIDAGYKLLQS